MYIFSANNPPAYAIFNHIPNAGKGVTTLDVHGA